ncbi:glycosyltransferase family 2 protein [Enterococcus hailinensis]|uniref:glycosyltransferase family 2 protein n=1 Tax=Enterococcus hailinensis TaxID=3238988 RepID=UPI0038B3A7C2
MCEISIIVPVYKVEKYLEKCVDSILAQTFTDFELILVDDGSPDNSGTICDEYAKKDPRVKVIHKENGGLSSARNAGINIAKGKYLGFIDSDDYIADDMYEILYKNIVKYNADISSIELISVYNDQFSLKRHSSTVKVLNQEQVMRSVLEGTCFYAYAWNKLYRRELFETIRFPQGRTFEDAFIIMKLLSISKKFVVSNLEKYYYVRHKNSIMGSNFSKKTFDVIDAWKENKNDVLRLYPELADSYRKRTCWSYFFVLDKALLSREYNNYVERTIVTLSKKILNEKNFIMKYPSFTLNRKFSIVLLSINRNLYKYVVIKKNNKLYKS